MSSASKPELLASAASTNQQPPPPLRAEPATVPSELQPNGFCSSIRCLYKIADKRQIKISIRGTMMRSHKVLWIDNVHNSAIQVACNQRCAQIVVTNCTKLKLFVNDSVVVASKTLRVINCRDCEFSLEDCDVRKTTVHDSTNCKFVVTNDDVLAEVYRLFFGRGCSGNSVALREMVADRTQVEGGQNFRYQDRWTRAAPETLNNHNNVPSEVTTENERVGIISLFPLQFPIVGYLHSKNCPAPIPSSSAAQTEDPERAKFIANIPQDLAAHLQVRFFPSDDEDIAQGTLWSPERIMSDLKALEASPRVSSETEDLAFERERDEIDEWDTDREAVVAKVAQVVELMKKGNNSSSAAPPGAAVAGGGGDATPTSGGDETTPPPSTVIFAGAGISSSMLGDFRGGGAGSHWTSMQRSSGSTATRASGAPKPSRNVETATPTFAHYAIAELVRRGLCSQVVTTNYDSLFFAAGLLPHQVVTMHGDAHTLFCPTCATETRKTKQVQSDRADGFNHLDHRSSKTCWFCGTQLLTTIVNFGDTYSHWTTPARAEYYCRRASLAISVGNSGAVQPAVFYPTKATNFVMVNKQATPMDYLSNGSVRLFTTCDVFFVELMHQLGIESFPLNYDARASEWTDQIEMEEKHAQLRVQAFVTQHNKEER